MKYILALSLLAGVHMAQAQTTVFSTDFDSSVAAPLNPGTAALTGVQGFAGLGPAGHTFGGQFLRSATGNVVTLTLGNLPTHDQINLDFLFAAIDSLDGTGSFPSGDFFKITLDGQTIFRESFANALPSQIQSYVPPTGVELARHVDLGFGGPGSYYTDSAYNLGADPTLQIIAHTGAVATFTFQVEGEGIQTLNDESWAMDRLSVSVSAVPEPEVFWLAGAGLLALWAVKLSSSRARPPRSSATAPGASCGTNRCGQCFSGRAVQA
ncbi:PEP-CTERM sorting domain-containing protein [Aquabacterium sp.]|uniref:PEP-CTERM sorting domain-containing protein n=1 Tax=Aquabacterium sp. TaxID=1872578 RepID=UPI0019AF40F0|nr:PEP-CTERM sorting domain-containing protein [Aquabacterium sp.]MBC7699013.1 PEP-CTERM sorting domain-containing protein [Aquabacterium sp.]